ncbi:MAG: hypothetical protein U0797_01025 [Gemmataceae bacterium]
MSMTNKICGMLVSGALAGLTGLGVAVKGMITPASRAARGAPPAVAAEEPYPDAALARARRELVDAPGPLPPAASEQQLKDDIDRAASAIASGLGQAEAGVAELRKLNSSWLAADRSVGGMGKANAEMEQLAASIIRAADADVVPALKALRQRLKEAPAIYRRLAAEKRAKVAPDMPGSVRRHYEDMADWPRRSPPRASGGSGSSSSATASTSARRSRSRWPWSESASYAGFTPTGPTSSTPGRPRWSTGRWTG